MSNTSAKSLKGYDCQNPMHSSWSRTFSRAAYESKRRGLIWNITIEQAWNKINGQSWRCALSNVAFTTAGSRDDCQASLDRIDSDKGYEPDNIQYVTLRVNYCKRELSESKFIELCKQISLNAEKSK